MTAAAIAPMSSEDMWRSYARAREGRVQMRCGGMKIA